MQIFVAKLLINLYLGAWGAKEKIRGTSHGAVHKICSARFWRDRQRRNGGVSELRDPGARRQLKLSLVWGTVHNLRCDGMYHSRHSPRLDVSHLQALGDLGRNHYQKYVSSLPRAMSAQPLTLRRSIMEGLIFNVFYQYRERFLLLVNTL